MDTLKGKKIMVWTFIGNTRMYMKTELFCKVMRGCIKRMSWNQEQL